MTTTSKANSKKKKKKRTTGISRRRCLVLFALPIFPLLATEAYALLAGTVFRETGHALAGAEIEFRPLEATKQGKRIRAYSSPRGEFAVRVPPGPAEYIISVKIDHYQEATKSVKIVGDERVDVTFLMEPRKKL